MDILHESAPDESLLKIIGAAAFVSILILPAMPPPVLFAVCLIIPAALCISLGGGRGLLFFLIFLLLVFGVRCRYLQRTESMLPFPSDKVVIIEARLLSEPGWDSRGNVRVAAELLKAVSRGGAEADASGQCAVILAAEKCTAPEAWFRGDLIRVKGRMANPRSRGDCRFYGRSIIRLSRIGSSSPRIRIHSVIRDRAEVLGGYSRVLLPALVLGQRDADLEEAAVLFRETGTAHIIALSGFHSGLVAVLLFLMLRPLLGYRAALALSAAGLIFYLYLAGPKPSLMRAVLMYVLVIAGRLQYKKADLKRVLAASYFITALIIPESLHTLSARLSYLALWGILDSAGLFSSFMESRLPRFLSLPLAAGLAAQLWTFPLVLYSFGIWYPAGIPASLILTPLVSVYMYAGILYLMVPQFLAAPFVFLCRILEMMMTGAAELFRKIPSFCYEAGAGVFLFLLFPLLLGLIYRPGGFHAERKSRSQLRFGIRDQSAARYDGAGTPQALGTELSDQPGCQGEDHQAAGTAGG